MIQTSFFKDCYINTLQDINIVLHAQIRLVKKLYFACITLRLIFVATPNFTCMGESLGKLSFRFEIVF